MENKQKNYEIEASNSSLALNEIKIDINSPKSNKLHRRYLSNKIEQQQHQWKLGKTKIDERLIKYLFQMIIIFITICFCFYKLISCEKQQPIYIGILSSLIGYVLPTPSI